MAVLVFLARTAGTWVVTAYTGSCLCRHHLFGSALSGRRGLLLGCLTGKVFFCLAKIGIGTSGQFLACLLEFGLRTARRLGSLAALRGRGRLLTDENLSAHEGGHGLGVEVAEHVLEEMERLDLINHEGVFLLVGGILHRLAQLVELAQVLFPEFVDSDKHQSFVPCLDDVAAFGINGLLHGHTEIEHTLSVGDRHEHETCVAGLRHHVGEHWEGDFAYAVALAVEGGDSSLVELVDFFLTGEVGVFFLGEGSLDCKSGEDVVERSGYWAALSLLIIIFSTVSYTMLMMSTPMRSPRRA